MTTTTGALQRQEVENFVVIAFDKETVATVEGIVGPGAVYYDAPWLQGKKV